MFIHRLATLGVGWRVQTVYSLVMGGKLIQIVLSLVTMRTRSV